MTTFEDLGIPAPILAAIKKVGFTTPTPIQAQAIPLALQGRDVLGSAQTGTGKTAAFGIPMIARLIAEPRSTGIIMTPTRELAAQVLSTLHPLLAGQHGIRTALLIGGEPMPRQYQQLRQNPRIIVGTPGRINDHLERRSLNLANAHFLVLDETDRMLDMGFGIQIDRILQYMPKQRQTLLFSATIPPEIEKLAQKYQNKPERISIGAMNVPIANVTQELLRVSEGDKYPQLLAQLQARGGSIIVFVKTKHGAKRLAEKLSRENLKADTIHGNLNQNKRDRVIQGFRAKRFRILVATDVAARGLDIPHIEHVINYDLPQCAEDYIHRIGRTARAGATGTAVAFITPSDGRLWHAIHKLLNPGDKSPMPRTNDRPQNRRGRGSQFGGARPFSRERKFGGERAAPAEQERRRFEGPRSKSRKFDPPRAERANTPRYQSKPRPDGSPGFSRQDQRRRHKA
ncbi:MAG: DEAD/DEAH box helicase [Proteobacteria bacterium]|nr:DEAD/DEAH box helicase [Pseudomonadota bacterium]